jgi:hypothetical protein
VISRSRRRPRLPYDQFVTLVVARIIDNNRISIVSDTMTVDRYSRRHAWFDALKILVVRPDLAVCVAGVGVPNNAERIDKLLSADWSIRPEAVIAYARTLPPDGEYIVAWLDGGAHLERIRSGHDGSPPNQSWIGDRDAFSAYQETWNKTWGSGDLDRKDQGWRMLRSLTDVLGDPRAPTVGGAAVRVANDDRGFGYVSDSSRYGSAANGTLAGTHLTLRELDEGQPTTMQKFVPVVRGFAAVGLWWMEGRFGYLFAPASRSKPLGIHCGSADGFRQYCERICGVPFSTSPAVPEVGAH